MTTPEPRAPAARPLASIVVIVVVLVGMGAGGLAFGVDAASAGDNAAHFEMEPETTHVEPGETVTIDVLLTSHGSYGTAGVESIDLRIDVHPEYATIREVEAGNWFEDAPEEDLIGADRAAVTVTEGAAIDADAGTARLVQQLEDPGIGVIGAARVATITLAIEDDAGAATVELSTAESTVRTVNGYQQPTVEGLAELRVDGGGDRVTPAFDPDAFADHEGLPESEPSAADDGIADRIPAPTGAVVVGILLAALFVRYRGR